MGVLKSDYPPLLAPGRHFLTLPAVEALCVLAFDGASRAHREKLYLSLEELIQSVLRSKLPCRIYLDGSFLTSKPLPDDIDIVLSIDWDVAENLTEDQRQIVDLINNESSFAGVDSSAFFSYPHDHECYGYAFDANNACEGYGIEHSKSHLKGYVVLRLWETDVGLRICH